MTSSSMKLHVYSLEKAAFERNAVSVNVKTAIGELTILDNHRPLIAPLAKGSIRIIEREGNEQIIEAIGGLLEIRPGSDVTILLD